MTEPHICPRCLEQYDISVNPEAWCMSCQGMSLLIEGAPVTALPPHHVVEEGVNVIGQRYIRVAYPDGTTDLIDPVPWSENL
jgi:hypothetical protein